MRHALALARRGEGHVEPNPQVGAVIVDDHLNLLGEGFHGRFGGPHAEIGALAQAGDRARGATLYLTLEPCSHFGKTPPCADAVIAAGLARVVVSMQDPFPAVAGRGLARLREAGIAVEVGLLAAEARELTAPFCKLVETGLPFVHAKWAMTLDGKLATRTGASRWISNERSREIVHRLRGRMDAILVGRGTAEADDPLLTARPPGPRSPARFVLDSQARLSPESQLVRTAGEAPVIVATSEGADASRVAMLEQLGVEVLRLPDSATQPGRPDVLALLQELGRRRMTNLLVEGGAGLFGALMDREMIDELHVFVGPRLFGGAEAKSPVGGLGLAEPPAADQLDVREITAIEGDVYIRSRWKRTQ
jgi:diaminohydroxyphosphoribosylaminopyrimidine deaminase/5-amino-6-(5-phosphoribosylamino)uracil reductase